MKPKSKRISMKFTPKKVVWKVCTGEAHSNPWIDHCYLCMPYWAEYPTCPDCGAMLREARKNYTCRACHLQFNKETNRRPYKNLRG